MKKLLVAMVAMGLAGFAQASYLYWQVTEAAVNEFASGEGAYGVQVKYGNTVLDIKATDGSSVGTVVDTTTAQNPGYLVNIADLTAGSSFYIELVKYNSGDQWDTVGVSQALTYTTYADIGNYTVDLQAVVPTLPAAWTGGSYAAPEPTSGLLMLLGVAALGLKRRKA